jgi:hypothetical protein
MAKSKDDGFVDAGRMESEKFEPDPEVKGEFAETAGGIDAGQQELIEKLRDHHSTSPSLSGGDVDAAWDRADEGEETVGGSAPTPDQDVVEEIGQAMGITYEDDEPLRGADKIEERDRHRWELDPASSEDYRDRK